MMITNTKEDLT